MRIFRQWSGRKKKREELTEKVTRLNAQAGGTGGFKRPEVISAEKARLEAARKKEELEETVVIDWEAPDQPDHPYIFQYEKKDSGQRVDFINPRKRIQKIIVDNRNTIRNFPGVEHEELLQHMLNEGSTRPNAEFGICFYYEPDGRHLVVWEIQPDGRYWADEYGFGGNGDSEIRLYSYLDEDGNFTAPFRLYKTGAEEYFNTDLEDQMAAKWMGQSAHRLGAEEYENYISGFLQKMAAQYPEWKENRQYTACEADFELFGTYDKATLEINHLSGKTYFGVTVCRLGYGASVTAELARGSDEEVLHYIEKKETARQVIDNAYRLSRRIKEYYHC